MKTGITPEFKKTGQLDFWKPEIHEFRTNGTQEFRNSGKMNSGKHEHAKTRIQEHRKTGILENMSSSIYEFGKCFVKQKSLTNKSTKSMKSTTLKLFETF